MATYGAYIFVKRGIEVYTDINRVNRNYNLRNRIQRQLEAYIHQPGSLLYGLLD